MRTLSEDLWLRAVRLVVEEGLSLHAVGRRLCIGEATVSRWTRQYRRTGSVAARPTGIRAGRGWTRTGRTSSA